MLFTPTNHWPTIYLFHYRNNYFPCCTQNERLKIQYSFVRESILTIGGLNKCKKNYGIFSLGIYVQMGFRSRYCSFRIIAQDNLRSNVRRVTKFACNSQWLPSVCATFLTVDEFGWTRKATLLFADCARPYQLFVRNLRPGQSRLIVCPIPNFVARWFSGEQFFIGPFYCPITQHKEAFGGRLFATGCKRGHSITSRPQKYRPKWTTKELGLITWQLLRFSFSM
jgi:hypothetical protein